MTQAESSAEVIANSSDRFQLIKTLQDGRFHSGEELGKSLGISRSAVWKRIQKINSELGIIVHSVPGRGYKLDQKMIALDPGRQFEGKTYSWSVRRFDTLDSTNAEALRLLDEGETVPFAVVSEQQSSGRGRRGRVWVSPFGENLYFSLVFKIDQGVRQLEGLSLVLGLAVLHTLRGFGLKEAGLKWPNDVLVSDRKIAGVLVELAGDLAEVCHVVIGIGINANMLRAQESIGQKWTSIALETGKIVDRNILLEELQVQLDGNLAAHMRLGFAALREEWEANNLWHDQPVVLSSGTRNVTGVVRGVDSTGALVLLVDGQLCSFSGGEISLRLQDDSRG